MKNRLFRLFTLLFAAAVLLLPLSGLAAQTQLQAKNVIILVGDGMGPSQFGGLMHNTEIFTVMKAALRLK